MLDVIRNLRRDGAERDDAWRLAQACRQLLTERDESNSRAIASATLERWRGLDADGVNRFFKLLASDFDPDPGEVLRLAENYAISRSPDNLVKLARAAEPPRQERLRRLNRAAGGTAGIVQMRSRLLAAGCARRLPAPAVVVVQPRLPEAGAGGLELAGRAARADHPARGGPRDRRLERPAARPPLQRGAPEAVRPEQFKVAAFSSISNCQPGLRGVALQARRGPRAAAARGQAGLAAGGARRPACPPRRRARRAGAGGGAERAVGPFHLNNGARLQRVNVSADLSRKGLRQSFGLMVNYMYDPDEIEVNHERFMQGEVAASRAVLALM
jgi:hypothetical protein